MTFFKKSLMTVSALALSIGIAGSTVAQDAISDVSVQVTTAATGTLSVEISDLAFGQHEYSLEDRPVEGDITITATDNRGSAAGWSVNLSGDDFVEDTFTIDNLTLTGDSVETVSETGHASEQAPNTQDAAPVLVQGSTVLTAEPQTGAGIYKAHYLANLTIPAGTLVDTYETTLTVTITGDEPGND